MKSKFIKLVISKLLIACLVFSSVGMAFAATAATTTDIKGHWAEPEITSWIEKGFIKGYEDNSFKPNNSITRAEFIALVNRSFAFTEQASISFSDVKTSNWAYVEIAKGVKAGYITGYADGTIGAGKTITRQEVAVIVDRLLGLSAADSPSAFKDGSKIGTWAKDAVDSAVAAGILKGYAEDNTFKPANAITRAEAVVTLDRAIAPKNLVYNTAGTYGPATGNETVNKDVVINTTGVVLQNMTLNGKLLFAAGIGSGDATLKNVTVKGETTVQGGGVNSIHLEDSVLATVIVDKDASQGSVRIVAEGTTTVGQVNVNSPVSLQETNATGTGFGNVTLSETLPTGSEVTLKGSFDSVVVVGDGIKVLLAEGSVKSLTVSATSTGTTLDVAAGTTITALNLDVVTPVTGKGTITMATLSAAVQATGQQTFETAPGTVVVGTATATPEPTTAPGTGTGGSGNGGSGGDSGGGNGNTDPVSANIPGVTIANYSNAPVGAAVPFISVTGSTYTITPSAGVSTLLIKGTNGTTVSNVVINDTNAVAAPQAVGYTVDGLAAGFPAHVTVTTTGTNAGTHTLIINAVAPSNTGLTLNTGVVTGTLSPMAAKTKISGASGGQAWTNGSYAGNSNAFNSSAHFTTTLSKTGLAPNIKTIFKVDVTKDGTPLTESEIKDHLQLFILGADNAHWWDMADYGWGDPTNGAYVPQLFADQLNSFTSYIVADSPGAYIITVKLMKFDSSGHLNATPVATSTTGFSMIPGLTITNFSNSPVGATSPAISVSGSTYTITTAAGVTSLLIVGNSGTTVSNVVANDTNAVAAPQAVGYTVDGLAAGFPAHVTVTTTGTNAGTHTLIINAVAPSNTGLTLNTGVVTGTLSPMAAKTKISGASGGQAWTNGSYAGNSNAFNSSAHFTTTLSKTGLAPNIKTIFKVDVTKDGTPLTESEIKDHLQLFILGADNAHWWDMADYGWGDPTNGAYVPQLFADQLNSFTSYIVADSLGDYTVTVKLMKFDSSGHLNANPVVTSDPVAFTVVELE